MSRPSQKHKKFARKPTPRCPTLETIREDEDLVATATLSALQGPNSLTLNAFQKTSKRRRRGKVKKGLAGSVAVSITQVSVHVEGVFKALWRAIDPRNKSNLIFHLGQLQWVVDEGREDELAIIEFRLDRVVRPTSLREEVVPPFMAMLRDSPINIIIDLKALAEDMIKDCDVDMAGSDHSIESTSNKSSQSGKSDDSMESGKSDMSLEKVYPLSPNEGPNNEST